MKLLQNKTNIQNPNTPYPYGKMKDNPGDNSGTPLDTELFTDYTQFFEKLFDMSGLTANDLPDNATNGFQLFEAAATVLGLKKKVNIGSWNMQAAGINVPTGIDFDKVVGVDVYILNDDQNQLNPLLQAGSYALTTASGVVLSRDGGGFFDSANYNSTSVNRGYILVHYTL